MARVMDAVALHAIGDAAHRGAHKGRAAFRKAREHYLEPVMDGGEGIFLIGQKTPARVAMILWVLTRTDYHGEDPRACGDDR